ncbi:hypothetical protein BHD05_07705 [Marisediminicola antarctica]|uniref:Uncharacterized protein n=1 Tax=Marisediminicola antarctica TaxID=674079 RepID=A0A7L5AJH4_9MICO|nr:hypothetical protein BHD05_07705 [Marisediminicola antarctica]
MSAQPSAALAANRCVVSPSSSDWQVDVVLNSGAGSGAADGVGVALGAGAGAGAGDAVASGLALALGLALARGEADGLGSPASGSAAHPASNRHAAAATIRR